MKWLILGDSHGAGAYAIFSRSYPEVNFLQLTIPGCGVHAYQQKMVSAQCSKLQTEVYDFVRETREVDGVILASNWRKRHLGELPRVVRFLTKADKRVVVLNKRIRFKRTVPDILSSSQTEQEAQQRAIQLLEGDNAVLAGKLAKLLGSDAAVVDMQALQCPDGLCDLVDEDANILYTDDSHLSVEGMDLIGRRIRANYPDLLDSGRALGAAEAQRVPVALEHSVLGGHEEAD